MPQSSRTTLRARSLAGLSVGALVASLGVTFLGAGVSSAAPAPEPVTKDFTYACDVPLLGPQEFSVSVTATPPADPVEGKQVPESDISTTVEIPESFAVLLPGDALNVATVEGTVDAATEIVNDGNTRELTVKDLVLPATSTTDTNPDGSLSVTATGKFPAVTFNNPGLTTISVGDVTAKLDLKNAAGQPAEPIGELELTCTNQSDDTTLLSFPVAEAPVPPVKVDYTVNGTATQATTGITTEFGPGSLDAVTDVDSGNFSGELTLPVFDIPDYQLFGFLPTTAKLEVIPEGSVTGTIDEDGTLNAQSPLSLRLDELSVFGVPLLTPGSTCQTVEPTTVDLTGPNFDPETGGTLSGSYTAANFSGCGLLGFFIEPMLNGGVSGIDNAISVDFAVSPVEQGPLD